MTLSSYQRVSIQLAMIAVLVGGLLATGPFQAEAGQGSHTVKTVALRDATWHVRTDLAGGSADHTFTYGRADDTPLIGDWNGNDRPTPGVSRGSRFHLNNSLSGGAADKSFTFGRSDDTPIVGDWNGDGTQTVGVVRGNTFYLRNSNSGGNADITFSFGRSGDTPIVGDWNGDGTETVGVVRGNTFYLRNRHAGGAADETFSYGRSSDEPVAGDWNRNGVDTVGVVRGSTYLLRNSHSGGAADREFTYGAGSDTPLIWSAFQEPETPSAPSEPRGVWDDLAQCESNENWSANTGNGYYGGLQFHPNTWAAYGGHAYASNAHLATREQEIEIARKVQAGQGWGAWPACSSLLGLR